MDDKYAYISRHHLAADRANERLHAAGLGAFFRPSQLSEAGLTPDQLPSLVRRRVVEHVTRGLYRLLDAESTENYSLAMAAPACLTASFACSRRCACTASDRRPPPTCGSEYLTRPARLACDGCGCASSVSAAPRGPGGGEGDSARPTAAAGRASRGSSLRPRRGARSARRRDTGGGCRSGRAAARRA